jgi:hypothetical protein
MTIKIEAGTLGTLGTNILYDNAFHDPTAVITASTATADGQPQNATNEATWDFWVPTAVPATLKLDAGAPIMCNAAAVAAHNLGTVGATIQVQSSPDDATWTTRGSEVPTDDGVVIILFPDTTAQYWRLRITNAVASIGVAFIGTRLKFANSVLSGHVGLNNAKRVELLNATSIGGQFLGNRIRRVGAETTVNFGLVDTTFADGDFSPFKDWYNDGHAFFFASSPSVWPDDIGYCWRPEGAGEIRPVYEEGGLLTNLSMDVAAYVGT